MLGPAALRSRNAVRHETDQLAHLNVALAERYRVERELGHGAMAMVYLAQDLKLDRPVALKVLRPELAAALGSERFLREVRITARLNHPHILPLHDSGEAEGYLYYAMPYVEGESLRDRLIREKQLSVDDTLQIVREVADALSYAHNHDVVHRDIKPENILLESGHAVVADFGIARAITAAGGDRITETGIAVGTPAYMSPEQAAGSTDFDGRSDLYSLGCVLHEMLAGQPPFTGPTVESVLHQHLTGAPPSITSLRPAVPGWVAAALSRALAKTPADRFASAMQLGQALESTAHSVTADSVAARVRSARRLALGMATVVGIIGVVAVALILTRRLSTRGSEADLPVVVMPFENRTPSTELDPLGMVVAEWVTQGLTELPFLTVLDTRGAQAAARRLGAVATPEAVRHETGAGIVVAGSYVLQGDSLQFQAQISSTAAGNILLSISGLTAPRDEPMVGVERLRQRVLAGFASLHNRDITTFQTELAHPPAYAAYRDYVEGLELYMRAGSWSDAGHRFLQAAVLDSTFLTARIWAAQWGVIDGKLARDEEWAKRADSLIRGLQPLRGALSPFDRARLDFVVGLRDEDLLEAYRAALRLLDASPGSVDARREAAISALRALRPREALRRLEELDPKRGLMREWEGEYWGYVSSAHHLLGEHEEELAAVRQVHQVYGRPPGEVSYIELRVFAALGRIAQLDSLVRDELPRSGHGDLIAFGIAGELRAHGHAEAARRLIRFASGHPGAQPPSEQAGAREWLDEHLFLRRIVGDPWCYLADQPDQFSVVERVSDEWIHWRAEMALLNGDIETAASRAAQLHVPTAHGTLLARILAAQGKVGAARAEYEHWEARMMQARGTLSGLELDRASVLVRLGDRDRALKILSEGIGRRPLPNTTNGWDGHANPKLEPLWSDPRFQELIKPKG